MDVYLLQIPLFQGTFLGVPYALCKCLPATCQAAYNSAQAVGQKTSVLIHGAGLPVLDSGGGGAKDLGYVVRPPGKTGFENRPWAYGKLTVTAKASASPEPFVPP